MLTEWLTIIGIFTFVIGFVYFCVRLSKQENEAIKTNKNTPYKKDDKEIFRALLRYIYVLFTLISICIFFSMKEAWYIFGLLSIVTWLYMMSKGIHLLRLSKKAPHPNTRYNIVGITGAFVFMGSILFLIIAGGILLAWLDGQKLL
jgi:magnesium-transporting ATPase (P-type)